MFYRFRRRCLLYCGSLFIVLFLPVSIIYLTSPVLSSGQYSNQIYVSHHPTGGRSHFHRTGECEVVDVAISLASGQESCNRAALLIKSILIFREGPIRLHLLLDSTCQHVLGTLLRTWHVYGLEYHLYLINGTGPHDRSTTLQHLMDSLPHSIERVISLSPEVLMSVDVHHLWSTFNNMQRAGRVLFAAVLEPQLRTELLLIDVKNLREGLGSRYKGRESLAIESLYSEDKSLFYALSPGWSIHANDHTMGDREVCYDQQTRCVHSSAASSEFKSAIQNYDGNLLRERWINCQTGPTFDRSAIEYRNKVSVYTPPCTDFKREGNQERRTHPFYAGQWPDTNTRQSSSSNNDLTLVLHVTLDRMVKMLEPMCLHWEGPMSIAVFANDSEVSHLIHLIQSSTVISSRHNIAYHMVYKEGVQMYYPINPLRITAMENAGSKYLFLNDMDFLPSFGLYHYLREMVDKFDLSHAVLVVPAFETYEEPETFIFPRDKSSLRKLVLKNKVFQFHRKNYIRGHAPTDYRNWLTATKPYEITWQPQYEPYLVTRRDITPLDPRFVSRHFNKVSHTEQLYYEDYKFHVVPDGFILHLPHEKSSDAKKQKANERHRECYRQREQEWRGEMVQNYGYEPYLLHLYQFWNLLSSSYETSL